MERVVYADDEVGFKELHERIDKTIAQLEAVKEDAFDEKQFKPFVMEAYGMKFQFKTAQHYISEFVIPWFYFQLGTLYTFTRKAGVELGAMDYLHGIMVPVESAESS
jgi:uncharacterized protein